MSAVILSDSNVMLRMWCDDDIQPLTEAVVESIGSLRRYIPWMNPQWSKADSTKFVRDTANCNTQNWKAFGIYKDNSFIGSISLILRERKIDDRTIHYGTVGYWIRDSERGKGYCQESLHLLIPYGFDTFPISYIKFVIDEDNASSRHIAENMGAVIHKIIPEHLQSDLGKHTAIIYRLYRKTYEDKKYD
jgi:ribosomal-protein-serine acetyltransferase